MVSLPLPQLRRRRPPAARPLPADQVDEESLRPAAMLYVTTVVGLATVLLLLTVARSTPPDRSTLLIGLALTGCMTLAGLFPLHFSHQTKLYVDTAVTVAAVLLLPPAGAMAVAGAGTAFSHLLLPGSRDRVQALFNVALAMLLAATGGLFLAAAGWNPDMPTWNPAGPLLVLPVAAVVMHLLSVGGVATVVALQGDLPLVAAWRRALLEDPGVEAAAQLSLVATGVLAALVATNHPWAIALLAPPVGSTLVMLRQQAQLRQEAEQARLQSDAGLAAAQRLAQLGSWEWDPRQQGQAWSDETYRILGLSPGSIPPTHAAFLAAIDASDRPAVEQAIRAAVDQATPIWVEYHIRRPDGAVRLVQLQGEVRLDDAGLATRLVGTVRDVTERKTLEAQVADFAERQRTAAELAEARRRLAGSRETERLCLARDLHDGPVQDLIAISFQLAGFRRTLAIDPTAQEAASGLEQQRREILSVVGQLRGMIGELRPAGLAEFGLPMALEGYVAGLRQTAGAPLPEIVLEIDETSVELPQPLALTLFRVVQEALRNALRHAGADRITVCLKRYDDEVELRVVDDGRGFQVPPRLTALAESGHFGLVGIAERVDLAKGTLTVESCPAGTAIGVRLPLGVVGESHG